MLGKVVLTSYLLEQDGTAEWKSKRGYFNYLCKPDPAIALLQTCMLCPISLPSSPLSAFSATEVGVRVFWFWLVAVCLP